MEQSDITTVLDNLKIGVIIINRETHLLEFVNEEAAELLKFSVSDLQNNRCMGFICSNEKKPCPAFDRELPITRERNSLIRSDGSTLNILKTVRPISFNNRDCLLETFLDYTEAKIYGNSLIQRDERMQLAMVVGHVGIWDYSRSKGELFFDSNFYSMGGYEDGVFPPDFREWLRLVHEDDREETGKELYRFLEGQSQYYSCEFKFLHKENRYIWIRARGEVVQRDENSKPLRLLGIHLDISSEKEREMRRALLNRLQIQLLSPTSLTSKCTQITRTLIFAVKADFARIWIIGDGDLCESGCSHFMSPLYENYCRPEGKCLHLYSSSGRYENRNGKDSRVPLGPFRIGAIFKKEKNIIIENDLEHSDFIDDRQWVEELGYKSFAGLKLTDSSGSRIGVLALFSTQYIDGETGSYMESVASITSQTIINEQAGTALKHALQMAEKANTLMNGRELRIRQIKGEVNSLLGKLGRKEKYRITEETRETPSLTTEDERLNALSLAEDAEIARRELLESNEQLSLIKQAVNFSSDAVAISTIRGDFFYINSTFTHLFGISIAQMALESHTILFVNSADYNKALELAVIGQSIEGESWLYDKAGKKIPVFMRSAPFRDTQGVIIGIVWNFTDITIRKENEQKTRKDMEEQREMLRKANILQQSYIQKTIPAVGNFNIQGLFMPCEKLGGDFFKILKAISKEKLIIIMGDCTDHGLKASLDASLLSSVIDPHIKQLYEDSRTDDFLARVSRDYMAIADEDQYPTMMVMIVDLQQGSMFYSNANSELPYICRGNQLEILEKAGGMHIGYFEDPHYERKEYRFQRGDRLILYSDAVTEMADEKGNKHNRKTFENLVRECHGSSSSNFYSLVRELEQYNKGFPLEDDTTLIQLEYLEKEEYSFCFNDLKEWKEEQLRFKNLLTRFDYALDEREKVTIALSELLINAYVHGNKSDKAKTVHLEGEIDCAGLVMMIRDEGEGFDPDSIPDPIANIQEIMDRGIADEYTHGRGMRIARDFLSDVQWNSKGNVVNVTLKKTAREIITIDTIRL